MTTKMAKITKEDYKRFFPFHEIREPQERAIDFILNAFKTNRFVILEAGTGVGKSAIGVMFHDIYKVILHILILKMKRNSVHLFSNTRKKSYKTIYRRFWIFKIE